MTVWRIDPGPRPGDRRARGPQVRSEGTPGVPVDQYPGRCFPGRYAGARDVGLVLRAHGRYGARVTETWRTTDPGVLRLPSGRLVRGRGLRRPLPPGPPPTFAVHLLGERPAEAPWEVRWLSWPDFRLPRSPAQARALLGEAWDRAGTERVEVACGGGRGRTGTALACLAVLDGVPADQAVAYVRRHYHPRAVETPWQKRYVRRFTR